MTSGASFRFLQSGDFHLDQPLGGLPSVPDHLRTLFCEAPRRAAQQVVETAMLHEVDFVILTGDLLDPRLSSPRTIGCLLELFEQLDTAGINVYWAGGEADPPSRWPSSVALPKNVHVFRPGLPQTVHYEHDGEVIAAIIGQANSGGEIRVGDFRPAASGAFTIAAAYGEVEDGAISRHDIPYWALGGEEMRKKHRTAPKYAMHAGSPQGRRPLHVGQRSCTVVEVNEAGEISTDSIATDVVRWQSELVEIANCESPEELEKVLKNRMRTLVSGKGRRQLLVDWRVVIEGKSSKKLMAESTWQHVIDVLNKEFGQEESGAWTYELTIESASVIPESWYQEQTICGDFLRLTRELLADPDIPIELTEFLGEDRRGTQLSEAVQIETREVRRKALHEARRMGVQALRIDD